jgi:hypothetical protein
LLNLHLRQALLCLHSILDVDAPVRKVVGKLGINSLFVASVAVDIRSPVSSERAELDSDWMSCRLGMSYAVRVATSTTKLLSPTAEVATAQTQPQVFVELTLRAMPKGSRFDLPSFLLLQAKCVLAGSHLLLPGLNLFLPGEGVSLENGIHKAWKLSRALIDLVDATLIALDCGCGVVAVGLGLGGNGELRHLGRRLFTGDMLASALDIEYKRVARSCYVEERMSSVCGAATVEAVEAYIKASRIVLVDVRSNSLSMSSVLTMESKHCVQSSRYTDWFGPGARSSVDL